MVAPDLLDEDDTPEAVPVPGVEDAEEGVVRPDLLPVVAPDHAPAVVSRAGLTPQHGGLAQTDQRLREQILRGSVLYRAREIIHVIL